MDNVNKFIGGGLAFPIKLNAGVPVIESGSNLISSSIKMILGWTSGTRLFNERFGSLVNLVLEEPNDELLRSLAEDVAYDAIANWERRIIIQDVRVQKIREDKLELDIVYRIKGSNIENSLTFPYYKTLSI